MLRDLALPEDLPLGYHRLSLELEFAGSETAPLIVTPDKCHEPADLGAGARLWGVAVQLYTLRSANNWGIGDFSDLAELLRLAAAAGAGFVGISPVHALFTSDPLQFSPYSASSRHALNVMFIDVSSVLEVQGSRRALALMADPGFNARLAQGARRHARGLCRRGQSQAAGTAGRLRALSHRAPGAAHHARRRLPRLPARARRAACACTRCSKPSMAIYAAITARAAGWHNWPEEYRHPDNAAVKRFAESHADDVDFHGYLQWLAAEQLGAVRQLARELGLSVGLYGDYAVGVNASGSETWSDQTLYCTNAAIGAPPDPLGPGGQEWGIPPQDPRVLRRTAYAPFTALVRASMRNCGALRLDHVMSLFRQWWVPRKFKSVDGGYVHYPLEELLGVVALESHRQQCLVVGEDLGVVPDEIRRALPQFGVYHYKVVMFEQQDNEFVAPGDYVRHALATVTTHDLPTLHGWWSAHDIELWEKLGVLCGRGGRGARARRACRGARTAAAGAAPRGVVARGAWPGARILGRAGARGACVPRPDPLGAGYRATRRHDQACWSP